MRFWFAEKRTPDHSVTKVLLAPRSAKHRFKVFKTSKTETGAEIFANKLDKKYSHDR